MSSETGISWTDSTWNCITGCTAVSPGCARCYSAQLTATRLKNQEKYKGLAVLNASGAGVFTGKVRCHEDDLTIPLHWRKGRRIFVNSMSDTFHNNVPFQFIDRMFAVMALCPRHTFQVLTKRPEWMAEYANYPVRNATVTTACYRLLKERGEFGFGPGRVMMRAWDGELLCPWPLPSVWLGTSAEDQPRLDERIVHLVKCPAAVRFLSLEPLLGPLDLSTWFFSMMTDAGKCAIDQCIVGCESVRGKALGRHFDPDWARSIRDQCQAAGVKFFLKQMPVDGKVCHDAAGFPTDLRIREFPA